MDTPFFDAAREIVGPEAVLQDRTTMEPYLKEWRGTYSGRAGAVLLPATTRETAELVSLCARHRVAVVPQSGNTGLSGGAVGRSRSSAVILNLRRMNHIREIDVRSNTMTVEAGCVLEEVQNAARESERLFPLDLAARGSCRVGGVLATNAGGTNVLRYGNARDLTLGLEAVLADGRVWDGLSRLYKDNTGYDLKNLFVGSEGTLGIITAAVLRLFPLPRHRITAWLALSGLPDAVSVFLHVRDECECELSGCELISQRALQYVLRHVDGTRAPMDKSASWYLLLELTGNDEAVLRQRLETALIPLLDRGTVTDAVVADSLAQSQSLWALREHISDAQRHEGASIKHDISVPISEIPDFVTTTDAALARMVPGIRPCVFGHMGDGNLHYNLSQPEDMPAREFLARQEDVNHMVYDAVARFRGSFSAEHGVGLLKRDAMSRYKDATAIELMRAIKTTLDPDNVMNPGKVLPENTE